MPRLRDEVSKYDNGGWSDRQMCLLVLDDIIHQAQQRAEERGDAARVKVLHERHKRVFNAFLDTIPQSPDGMYLDL